MAWRQQQQQQQQKGGAWGQVPTMKPASSPAAGAATSWQKPAWQQKGGAGSPAQRLAGSGKGILGVAAAAAGPETYVVSTSGKDSDEVVMKTLVGEYFESDSNHGRKVYKKVLETATAENVDVFMYYWDQRDGPAFEGWWFGNKLGGTQVWSHNSSASLTPPTGGWKIPWDGAVRDSMSVVNKAAFAVAKNDVQSKVKGVASEIAAASSAAKTALEQAKAASGDYTSTEGLQTAAALLQPQLTALAEAMKKLTEAQRGASPEALRQVTQLRSALQTLMTSINVELGKVKSSKGKAEQCEKNKVADDRDLAVFNEVMPEAIAKSNAAEDAVEKALITSEMIAAGGEDLEEVKDAVTATEQAVQEAQKAMGEARIFLNAKQASARRFESDKAKAKAAADLGQLQSQLAEAQIKLNPLKNVRQEYVQRTAARKLVQEILEKLSPAEVDVDRAEEATAVLSAEGNDVEMMQQAQQAVTKAGDHMAHVIRFIESKKKTAVGKAKEELLKMEERAKASIARLNELKETQKEATERVGLEVLLKEATDKLQVVAQAVAKAADAETPFLMGVEELPLEEMLASLKACEVAATAANTAASIARMFVATKLVEARRFTAALGKEAQEKLKEFQAELETHTKKLGELKKATADRKRSMTMREAEHEVDKAEELAAKVAECGAALVNDEQLMELSSADIKEASEQTIKAEQVASKHLAETRKFLTARQIEAKGKESSSEVSTELIKYETRLRTAQTEILKYKKAASSVDQRLAAKKSFEDAEAKIEAAKDKIETLVEMSEAITKPAPAIEQDEESEKPKESKEKVLQKNVRAAEQAAADAQASLKAAGRFVDMQLRTQSTIAKEMEKLKPKIDELQEKLDSTVTGMKESSEKAIVEGIRAESEGRLKEVEECIQQLSEAERPFLPEAGDIAAESVSDALAALEAALQAANSAVSGAKTFVGVKKLATRRLSDASKKLSEGQLKEVADKLEVHAKSLAGIKKNMSDRKTSIVKREVDAKVEEAEKKVLEAEEATTMLTSIGTRTKGDGDAQTKDNKQDGESAPADEMKAACEKAGTTQQEARTLVTTTQKLLLARQKDAKLATSGSALVADIAALLDKLSKMVVSLDKLKVALRDQEHRFVAERLHQDAVDNVEKLEAKLASAVDIASPLTSDEEDMVSVVFLGHVVDRLRQHLKDATKTPKELFTELCDGNEGTAADPRGVPEAAFIAKMRALEAQSPEDMTLSEAQLKATFKRLAGKDSEEVMEAKFVNEFQTRYLCTGAVTMTDGMVIKGGKTVRKIEANEVLEGLGEPAKEEALGLMRVHVKAEKDGKEGYVTVAGNQGSVYLEVYTPYVALQRSVEQTLKELTEAAKETSKYLDTKAEELKGVRSGPLAETKSELVRLKPRVSKVQGSSAELKKKVSQADKKLSQVMEEEKKRRVEAADKKAAEAMVDEVLQAVNSTEENVGKIISVAEGLIASLGSDEDSPSTAMENSEKDLLAAQETLETTMGKIKAKMDDIKSQPSKGPYAEARNALVKLKVKVGALESKCKKIASGLKTARVGLVAKAEAAVLEAFRAHARAKAVQPDELFKQLSAGADSIPATALREWIPSSSLKAGELDMAMGRFAAGLTKLSLLEMLQEYYKCVKEIALTSSLEVKDGKTVRKLAKDELLEVLEVGKTDGDASLPRLRCRAIVDQKEGWVTSQGNQGTTFLERTSKPFYCCDVESQLHTAFESSSSKVRKVQPGEVLELLEGPRREEPPETLRLRGKATKDGKAGYITLRDMAGNDNFVLAKLLVCKQSIAITTTFDIAAGKAIRKLEVGEALEVLEGPQEDAVRSLSRIRVLTKKDSKEGWVTVKGNQGTAYAEESQKHYICKHSVPMESKLATGSTLIRQIEEGEAFEGLDAPKAEKRDSVQRARGRNLADGTEGWFTIAAKSFSPWSPTYKCMQSTVLNDGVGITDAKTLRKLETGEILDALQSPILEASTGLLRARVRARKDSICGFATVRGNQGTVFLKPVIGDSAIEKQASTASGKAASKT